MRFVCIARVDTFLPAYGSIAFYLGPNAKGEFKTHRWTLYVRSPDQTFDLSRAISKVVFQLHPSFPQPTRELTEPPFEITECGWGEFEASIRIVWKEIADERSTIVTHGIRLYPKNTPQKNADPSTYMNTQVPVVSEKYDEVVFTNPKEEFHISLADAHKVKKLSYPLSKEQSVLKHFRTYGDEGDVQAMSRAKKHLEGELRSIKDRLLKVDSELDTVKARLAEFKTSTKPVAKVSQTKKKPKPAKKLAASDQPPSKKTKTS